MKLFDLGYRVEFYGGVYFCKAEESELHKYASQYDSRYLTPEGNALLNSCLNNKIIKREWAKHPYKD